MNINEWVLRGLANLTDLPQVSNLSRAFRFLDEKPHLALNLFLKAVLEVHKDNSAENLRLALVNYDSATKTSLNLVLKFISESNSPEITDKIRVAFLCVEGDPKQSLNLILKALVVHLDCESLEYLRKSILTLGTDGVLSLNFLMKFLPEVEGTNFIQDLRKAFQSYSSHLWRDAFSVGQIQSKKWLLDEWEKIGIGEQEICFVVGGWCGVLPAMTFLREKPMAAKIRSFDIDPKCAPIAETINKTHVLNEWSFKATTLDMFEMDYYSFAYQTERSDGSKVELVESPDIIINTSCEHILDFEKWFVKIPQGKYVILQTNDFFEEESHVNCVQTLQEFKSMAPLSDVLFEGTLKLEKYSRFMLIGRK